MPLRVLGVFCDDNYVEKNSDESQWSIQSCQFEGAVIGSCGNAKNVRGCFVPEDVCDCGCGILVEGLGFFFFFKLLNSCFLKLEYEKTEAAALQPLFMTGIPPFARPKKITLAAETEKRRRKCLPLSSRSTHLIRGLLACV